MRIASSRLSGWLARAAISLLIITWLVYRIDLASVWSTVRTLDTRLYLTLVGLYGLGVVAAGVKWRLLLPHQSLGSLIKATLIGQFYAVLLPGQIASEAMKAYRLGQGRRDAEQVAASVIVDKITGLLALMLLGFLGLYVARPSIPGLIIDSLFTLFLVGVVTLFALRWNAFHEWLQQLALRSEERVPALHGVLF